MGRGKGDRLFAHLKNINEPLTDKSRKINNLLKENRLGIDILAHSLSEKESANIESACIDLMGLENL